MSIVVLCLPNPCVPASFHVVHIQSWKPLKSRGLFPRHFTSLAFASAIAASLLVCPHSFRSQIKHAFPLFSSLLCTICLDPSFDTRVHRTAVCDDCQLAHLFSLLSLIGVSPQNSFRLAQASASNKSLKVASVTC